MNETGLFDKRTRASVYILMLPYQAYSWLLADAASFPSTMRGPKPLTDERRPQGPLAAVPFVASLSIVGVHDMSSLETTTTKAEPARVDLIAPSLRQQ
jgi:hypothetical protein